MDISGTGLHVYRSTARSSTLRRLDHEIQLVPAVRVVIIIVHPRVKGHQRVLRADVQVVVDAPVHLSHLARWVPQTLRKEARDGRKVSTSCARSFQ